MRSTKGDPKPIRFEEGDEQLLNLLAERTGFPTAELIRRAVRFAGPKFLSGEANIAELKPLEVTP